MAYATADDMISRFSREELESIAPSELPGKLDDAKIAVAIADAESEINSFLVMRYDVPVAEAPEIIKSACCDIARYRLYAHQATEEVNTRYQDRKAWLKSISKGEAGLGIVEKTVEKPSGFASTSSASDRVFTRTTLGDY